MAGLTHLLSPGMDQRPHDTLMESAEKMHCEA